MGTRRLLLVAATAAFAGALALLTVLNGQDGGPPASRPVPVIRGQGTDARIAQGEAAVRANPDSAEAYVGLGSAYLQKVRETGDASFYARADTALQRALVRDPDNPGALTERGRLRLGRHDFSGGLADGRRAHALAPDVVKPLGVMVDGLVELGRYGAAARTLQRMVDLRPDVGSYARVSYLRELHGDLPGALAAMRLAADAGGNAGETAASTSVLLGNLQFAAGRYDAAGRSLRTALTQRPGYPPALAGLAAVRAASGRLGPAIRDWREAVQRLPLPEYSVALGEAEMAAGRPAAARRDLELVRAQQKLLGAAGVNADVEMALFEADHGDPHRGVQLARSAWSAAPSVRSADALAWSLARAGEVRRAMHWVPRALATGTRDPRVLFRTGMAARAAGRSDMARTLLQRALSVSPRFSPLNAPRARRALEGL